MPLLAEQVVPPDALPFFLAAVGCIFGWGLGWFMRGWFGDDSHPDSNTGAVLAVIGGGVVLGILFDQAFGSGAVWWLVGGYAVLALVLRQGVRERGGY